LLQIYEANNINEAIFFEETFEHQHFNMKIHFSILELCSPVSVDVLLVDAFSFAVSAANTAL